MEALGENVFFSTFHNFWPNLPLRRELRAPVRVLDWPDSPPHPALPALSFETSLTVALRTSNSQQPQRYFSSCKHPPADKAENELQSHTIKSSSKKPSHCTCPVATQCCSRAGWEQRLQWELGKHSSYMAGTMWLLYQKSCF